MWKRIYYNGKPTKYSISKTGIVQNIKTGHVMTEYLNINGYKMVRLSLNKKSPRKEVLIHKLIANAFISNPLNKHEIHHIDKNKLNNDISNLQWVTHEEHVRLHANDLNHPYSKGELHAGAKLTSEIVHEICRMLQSGNYTQRAISKKFNVDESLIHEIRQRNNWIHISQYYDFSKVKGIYVYDESVIRKICEDISNDIGSLPYIANKENVTYDIVLRVYRNKVPTYSHIISQYDFSKFSHHKRYPLDTLKLIDKYIMDGLTSEEISKKLDINYTSAFKMLIYRRRKVLSK